MFVLPANKGSEEDLTTFSPDATRCGGGKLALAGRRGCLLMSIGLTEEDDEDDADADKLFACF
tara:strand:- start:108 stop:296 length:189 start_codon:yes stop_codon:yes gene_type:complete